MKPKVLIAGAYGMVGKALVSELKLKKDIRLLTPTKKELNYLNFEDVDNYFKSKRPNFVYIVAAKVGGILANKENKIEYLEDCWVIDLVTSEDDDVGRTVEGAIIYDAKKGKLLARLT